jgi:IPT/TIG domain
MAEGQLQTRRLTFRRPWTNTLLEGLILRMSAALAVILCSTCLLVAEASRAQTAPAPTAAPAPTGTETQLKTPSTDEKQQTDASTTQKNGNSKCPSAIWLLSGCGAFLLGFVALLHLWDSKKAYQYSAQARNDLLKKLPDKLSAEDLTRISDVITKPPDGISGTTRSIVTYSLVLVLAFGIFYLLTMSVDPKANDIADKLLTLLSGALTSVIGFYFGTKATAEGVAAQKNPKSDTPSTPATHIDGVRPPSGRSGDTVVVQGTGFGASAGNIEFGGIAVSGTDIQSWSDTAITLKIPPGVPEGYVDVSVNPTTGSRVVANRIFEILQ